MTYYPWRLLRYGRKGFSGSLNSPASSYSADLHGRDRYEFRRELLAYTAKKGDSPLISGHYPFNDKLYNDQKEQWNFVTLLRNPVERWYSEYFWNRYKDHDYAKTDLPIGQYMETAAGKASARSFVNFYAGTQNPTATPTPEEIQQACDTLAKMTVIGCLEHLGRFQSDMKIAFGRKPLFMNRNSSPAPEDKKIRPNEKSDTHNKLLDMLAADIEIYQYAKKLLKL